MLKSESSPIKAPNLFQARLGEEGPDKRWRYWNPDKPGNGWFSLPHLCPIWIHLASLGHTIAQSCGRIGFMLHSLAPRKHCGKKGQKELPNPWWICFNLMILKDLKMAVSCCVLDNWYYNWWFLSFFICRLLIYFVPRIDPRRPESHSVDNECRKMCWLENYVININ